MPSLRILGSRLLGPKYPRSWPRLRPCWPGCRWSRCPTPPPLHIAGGAQRRQHVICRRLERVHQTAWQRGRWHPRLLPQRRQHHRQAWLILQRQLSPIPPTHTEPWGGFPKGRWHPCLLPQRRQRYCRARPVLSCRLGFLPPTLYQRWGGAPPRRHAVLRNAVNSVWHSPCLNAQDLLMQIHG
jgi:hypothetical protein